MASRSNTPEERPIQVGDMVQIVKPSDCGCTSNLGLTRVVEGFAWANGRCVTCDHRSSYTAAILSGPAPWAKWHVETWRLKRIPPLSELGDVETNETADA